MYEDNCHWQDFGSHCADLGVKRISDLNGGYLWYCEKHYKKVVELREWLIEFEPQKSQQHHASDCIQ